LNHSLVDQGWKHTSRRSIKRATMTTFGPGPAP
jgi:hypothetical protein